MKQMILCLVLMVLFAAPAFAADEATPAKTTEKPAKKKEEDPAKPFKVMVNGVERVYYLYAPDAKSGTPQPVVFVFHGGGGNPMQVARSTGFSKMAEEGKFIVVYPEGSGYIHTWNAGTCCGYAERHEVDDVAFAKAILDELHQYYAIDDQRIYATGMSNGAMMAYRLACDMGDKFSAIAPVAGAMNTEVCMPDGRVSIAIFHAIDDKHVLFGGGSSEDGLRAALGKKSAPDASVDTAMQFWMKQNYCRRIPKVERMTGHSITTFFCAEGREVKLYALESGGHSWPGGASPLRPGADQPFMGLSATREIWSFFNQHPPRPLF